MAGSASGQDEANSDWLPVRARWAYLARSGLPGFTITVVLILIGHLQLLEKVLC